MASSRWKRFAFFDRKNLSLPPAVVKDIIPSSSSSSNNNKSSASKNNNNSDDILDPQILYYNDIISSDNHESIEDVVKVGCGEYFSLVGATNVSLPASLSSSSSLNNNGGVGDDYGHGGGDGIIEGDDDGNGMGVATRRGAGGDGASAMNAGLIALRQQMPQQQPDASSTKHHNVLTTSSNINNNAIQTVGGGDGELILLFASSRNTSLVHCIDVTVRCTPMNPHLLASQQQQNEQSSSSSSTVANNNDTIQDERGGFSNNNSSSAFASSNQSNNINNPSNIRNSNSNNQMTNNAEDLDGWRGHYNPFISCNGFVNTLSKDVNLLGGTTGSALSPPPKSSSKPSAGMKNKSSVVSARGKKSAAEQRILDEHLGSGGGGDEVNSSGGSLFGASPFANDFPVVEPSQKQTSSRHDQKARIVGLATCSGASSSSTARKTTKSSSTLYVAAITDTPNTIGIVVHANPHLMLSSLSPSSSSTSTSSSEGGGGTTTTPYSFYYKPSSHGAFNFDSHGKPRCVSILPGVVCVGTDIGIVLLYVFKCSDSSSGGKLSLVAEIPAPRGSSNSSSNNDETTTTTTTNGEKKMYAVSSIELIGPTASNVGESNNSSISNGGSSNIHRLFVSYRRRVQTTAASSSNDTSSKPPTGSSNNNTSTAGGPSGGVCCYDLGGLRIPSRPQPSSSLSGTSSGLSTKAPVVSARYDMDARDVGTSCLCDGISLPHQVPPSSVSSGTTPSLFGGNNDKIEDATSTAAASEKMLPRYAVARSDGLHLYSPDEKVGVCPIDGKKLATCSLPPPPVVYLRRPFRRLTSAGALGGSPAAEKQRGNNNEHGAIRGAGASYALVATTDVKSSRDAIDIYDTSNKLVGFHVLLSPGHRALRTVGIYSSPTVGYGSLIRGGRSSAVVLTSGGSIVTLTEKVTPDKIELLTQKNLYGAAISLAFSDPQFYCPEDIVGLYRRYAEHLYRKGDFSAAMDQYILTIGSLESSHVIFRYLDAPKIPFAVKYLKALREAGLASTVHDELLRTCYLKLGDVDAASKIILTNNDAMASLNTDGQVPTVPISRNLLASSDDPSEMLAAICSLNAPDAVQALVTHGVLIARSLPRETAGVVIALCDGSYSPTAMADAAAGREGNSTQCEKYPISLFANAFMENQKLFRLILSHCRRNDCVLTPMLRRTLLELTLDEWNAAKRTGDMHAQKLRHDEAISMLSEHNHVDNMGDYEALVIVQAAVFTEGEVILYERLNMVPMLLEEYAKSGTDRARRQMLAMCEQHDPEIFAEVLSNFVIMANERLKGSTLKDEASVDSESEVGGILHDIHEALVMATDHGELPPVRILRILAGERNGMFNCDDNRGTNPSLNDCGVPLSVAMDYVGAILDDSSGKIHRLKNNVEEYSRLCNEMEFEINSLLCPGTTDKDSEDKQKALKIDIDEMYSNLVQLEDEGKSSVEEVGKMDTVKEDFWREMEHADDPFETMCFYISKGYLDL